MEKKQFIFPWSKIYLKPSSRMISLFQDDFMNGLKKFGNIEKSNEYSSNLAKGDGLKKMY